MSRVTKNIAILFIVVSVLFTSTAQLIFSFVMKRTNVMLLETVDVATTLLTLDIVYLGLGIALYAASMLVWVVALTRFPVSLAYPMLSTSYVIVYVAATCIPILNETATLEKTIGVGLVAIGISVLLLDERLSDRSET